MERFEIGDRVRALHSVGFGSENFDEVGTVIEVNGGGMELGVVFDRDICGHDLNGKCKDRYGWWLSSENAEHYIEDLMEFEPASLSDLMDLIGG